MSQLSFPNDAAHIFMNELSSRVVAQSGIPTDRYHLGKLILQSLKDAPDFIAQIDGGTGQTETNGSVLERSVRCALSLSRMGLRTGDVMVLMAPNHLDLAIPFYAALYLGLGIAGQDRKFGVTELKRSFRFLKPNIVFCQSEKANEVQQVLNELDLESNIITFDNINGYRSINEFLGNIEDKDLDNFKASNFDTEVTNAFLVSTSGTTGSPKLAAVTHKHFAIATSYWWSHFTRFPSPTHLKLMCSSIVWLSAYISILTCTLLRVTRLQTSQAPATDHVIMVIKKYKPTHTIISSTFMSTLINSSHQDNRDLTSFTSLFMGGSAVTQDVIDKVKINAPNAVVLALYGMSETELGFLGASFPKCTLGQPVGCMQYRLVDIDSQKDILEPNVSGELWVKGPVVIKEYYNNPEATRNAFTNDGWFKTGDILYRDERFYYFFVDRLKMLLKFKNDQAGYMFSENNFKKAESRLEAIINICPQISPVEIEIVIKGHSGVLDVVVTAIPDEECGDLAVACVIRRDNCIVTAQEIKDLVKNNLSESKQLRGGVAFVDEFPLTPSDKINRQKLKEIVKNMRIE